VRIIKLNNHVLNSFKYMMVIVSAALSVIFIACLQLPMGFIDYSTGFLAYLHPRVGSKRPRKNAQTRGHSSKIKLRSFPFKLRLNAPLQEMAAYAVLVFNSIKLQ
jgi:hypothetical protein